MHRSQLSAIVVVFALCTVVAAATQTPATGSVSGVVTDKDGGVMPGASVTLIGPRSGLNTTTKSAGQFAFNNLEPGDYRIEVKLAGFRGDTRQITVAAGATQDLKIALVFDLSGIRVGERPDDPDSVEAFVRRMTGAEAVECGRHRAGAEEAELRKSVECALIARREKKSFHTIRQLAGMDSWIGDGLLGTSDGTVYMFSYDSAPCGGPGCAARFTVYLCRDPQLVRDSNRMTMYFYFGCGQPVYR